MMDILNTILGAKEFWTTIGGAVIGGGISYLIQLRNLREARSNRLEDRKRGDQALGHSLQFKMIKIHSNINALHRYVEECFDDARQRDPTAEPWQIILPLANLPGSITFASDEMGMLLGLRDDDVFNNVVDMDVVHNSLLEAVRTMNLERRALTEMLRPATAKGRTLSGSLDPQQAIVLRPRMIDINSVIEGVRTSAATNNAQSRVALRQLNELLRNKLGMTFRLHFPDEQPPAREANLPNGRSDGPADR